MMYFLSRWIATLIIGVATMLAGQHTTVYAYDIGCVYPSEMPEPFTARGTLTIALINYILTLQHETPIVVHKAHQTTYCGTNCISYHDDTSLNAFTKSRPPFSTPTDFFNSWSRTLCIVQCYAMLLPPEVTDALIASWDLELLPTSKELMDCDNESSCLQAIVKKEDYDPRLIGQVVYLEIATHLEDDGWNSLGSHTYDAEIDSIVDCTTNCAPYSDTTGYFPRNHPGQKRTKMRKKSKDGKSSKSSKEKYIVKGNDKLWQPLLETDDHGNFLRQDHVTPHIGYTAKPLLISKYKEAEKPEYDYRTEANLVVNRLQELVGNEERIQILHDFDNKLLLRGVIQLSMQHQFVSSLTFEDYIMFLSGISSAEHDAVLQVWREKVRYDRVRPTTVIQRWNDEVINTFNGDPSSTEPKDIKARDFQSFIRVMPHSEYPSGSASICTAYAEFTDLFTQEYFGENLNLLPVGKGGINHGCEEGSPFQIGCRTSYHVHNMTELASVCGESRLWGGMHFTKSVEAGNDIVSGLGQLALDFVRSIKAGSNWTNSYTQGSSRPVCGELEV